jgi:hypothetical protein
MSIAVHIERLVLDEALVASHRPDRIGAVVQAELERLLAIDGVAPELTVGGARARLTGGPIHLSAGAGVQEVGAQMGQAVYRALQSSGGHRGGISGTPNA